MASVQVKKGLEILAKSFLGVLLCPVIIVLSVVIGIIKGIDAFFDFYIGYLFGDKGNYVK